MTGPAVTVIVPTFNGAAVIADALRSVRAATGGETVELLVVDDCSTDDTLDIVRASSVGARILVLPENVGEAAARNLGLAHARGTRVTFLDQDDVVLPQHFEVLEETLAHWNAHASAPASISFCTSLDRPSSSTFDVEVPMDRDVVEALDDLARRRSYGAGAIVDYERAIDGGISNTVFASRELLIQAGGFAPLLRGTGDYLLLCNLARLGILAKADTPTYGYRVHSAMSTHRYDMARNVLLCRASLAATSRRPRLATAWDVELIAGFIRAERSGRVGDAAALGRLLRLQPRQWASVIRRSLRRSP